MNKKQILDEIFKRKAVAVLRVKEQDKLKKALAEVIKIIKKEKYSLKKQAVDKLA